MKTLFMSDLYPYFCDELSELGYKIIPTKNIKVFHKPERRHADMQLLKIQNVLFSLKDCRKTIGKSYPENISLNCLFFGNHLYGKLSAVDDVVLDFCKDNRIETVNVNQGYTRCSTLIISENAAITADKSIEKALKSHWADVLLISAGNIRLEGFDYGFIGGAGFTDNGKTYFFGDVSQHPDYEKIKTFCKTHNSNIEIICPSEPLTDIGGVVVIENE